jgi:hypothetical protein
MMVKAIHIGRTLVMLAEAFFWEQFINKIVIVINEFGNTPRVTTPVTITEYKLEMVSTKL